MSRHGESLAISVQWLAYTNGAVFNLVAQPLFRWFVRNVDRHTMCRHAEKRSPDFVLSNALEPTRSGIMGIRSGQPPLKIVGSSLSPKVRKSREKSSLNGKVMPNTDREFGKSKDLPTKKLLPIEKSGPKRIA
ncbi:hypothetical protein [Rhizobiales bacterium 3FA27D7]|jgi:hypothetical protein|uniref:hypothetical protein n=1 Tax=Mesorhizobium sp. 2RAF21 TaxID=3232995 RepID=UPI0010F792CE